MPTLRGAPGTAHTLYGFSLHQDDLHHHSEVTGTLAHPPGWASPHGHRLGEEGRCTTSQKSPSGAGRRRHSSMIAGPRPRRGNRDAHGKTKNTYNGWHARCVHVPLLPPHNVFPFYR